MTDLSTDHSRATLSGAHAHASAAASPVDTRGYVASRAQRPTSFNPADIPVPRGREEEWRFTPMARFKPLFDLEAVRAGTATAPVSVDIDAPAGAKADTVTREDSRVGSVGEPVDRTGVVAWDAITHATVLTLEAGAHLERAVRVQLTGQTSASTTTGGDVALQPSAGHLAIVARAGSHGTVVLHHRGVAALTQTVEITVEADADLTLVTIQDWDTPSVHASHHRAVVHGQGTLKHVVVTLGGDVRLASDLGFAGEGGHTEAYGVYFTDAGQHHEHRPYVAHTEPHCYSRVTYKGALQGEGAHSVWVGDCLIGAGARGTDTYELNRNLVLTEGAKADSIPNLEIENGNIEGAGHASAIGRFDDHQLFYLRARGIPEQEARRLVVLGFFNEIVTEIGVPEVEETLMGAIEAELQLTGVISA